MNSQRAIAFVRYHGVVLEGAKGKEPALAEHIAGERISGSWWAHHKGHEIYELTTKIRSSKAILVCTLASGKITYIHRRLWPSFVRLSKRFPPHALDQVTEIHSSSGRHMRQDIPFPQWVPTQVRRVARALSASEAANDVQIWLDRYGDI